MGAQPEHIAQTLCFFCLFLDRLAEKLTIFTISNKQENLSFAVRNLTAKHQNSNLENLTRRNVRVGNDSMEKEVLKYEMGPGVEAFSTRKECGLPYPVLQPHQTHSTRVEVIGSPDVSRDDLQGVDALVTDLRGVAIGVRTADCIPVLLYDPVKKVIGAAHSGWRGTINHISTKAVLEMARRWGSHPSDIRAAIGPGIGLDSFQVGEEVAVYFKESGFPLDRIWSFRGPRVPGSMEGGHHIDLKECIRFTLLKCGLLEANISVCPVDTYLDGSFYSARREGKQTGRIINSIKLL